MKRTVLIIVLVFAHANQIQAGVAGQAAKSIVGKVLGETAEAAAKKASTRIAAEAAEAAAREAAEATARQTASLAAKQLGATITGASGFADDVVRVTAKLTPRNERRLLILGPELAQSGQTQAVLSKMATGNSDEVIQMLWDHRGKLATAATVTALLVHGDDIVEATTANVAKPVIEGAINHVVSPLSWLFFTGTLMVGCIAFMVAIAYLFGGEATERVTGMYHRIASLFGKRR